jgi:hypothetical protein
LNLFSQKAGQGLNLSSDIFPSRPAFQAKTMSLVLRSCERGLEAMTKPPAEPGRRPLVD